MSKIKSYKEIAGNIVDVLKNRLYFGRLIIDGRKIIQLKKEGSESKSKNYILPGFVDSHIHIESSMLPPTEFARVATVHGTVAAVCDPHEIANIIGLRGIKYMLDEAQKVPFKFYFGVPSCVPASPFETNGAKISPKEVERLLKMKEIKFLAEVMNFSGVINNEPPVMKKIALAKKYKKPIDGHAPGLQGQALEKYIKAGISTDHESFSLEEAKEKISLGMKIQIREGSAAKDFNRLIPLADKNYKNCMFASDDKHPDDLIKGHINEMVKKALREGIDLIKVIRIACLNPVLHYGLDVGLLQKRDSADFIIIDNPKNFKILEVYIAGQLVAKNGRPLIEKQKSKILNNFAASPKKTVDFKIPYQGKLINVIGARDGQLLTDRFLFKPRETDGYIVSDTAKDILKLAVINRYHNKKPALGMIKGFGLKKGAIASSIAHDSHNIVAIGTNDEDICRAINLIIKYKGGLSAVAGSKELFLPLPIAGLMSDQNCEIVAKKYLTINKTAKSFGSKLRAPFMTLSFMTLSVIPKIKLTDNGLFDGEKFKFINLFN